MDDNNQGQTPVEPVVTPEPATPVEQPVEPVLPGDGVETPVVPTEVPASEPEPAMPGDGGTTPPATGI